MNETLIIPATPQIVFIITNWWVVGVAYVLGFISAITMQNYRSK